MSRSRILVVDDEPELRLMLRRYLETEGFKVAEATDGETALSRIHDTPPDLIVLDVGLPGIDGFAVLQEIRKTSQIPVIMLTALADDGRLLGFGDRGDRLGCSAVDGRPETT